MINRLQIEQLNAKMQSFANLKNIPGPGTGWIRAIRTSIGMSLEQLGNKLNIAKQNAQKIEKREVEGNITLNTLRDVAKALDMQLVYAFVPIEGSLDAMIDKKANEVAIKIVMRTSNSMKLEDQENTEGRLQKAIAERADELKRELPKILWD
ncbi:MAG: mobile mystery protein A [Flavitalea sp.]